MTPKTAKTIVDAVLKELKGRGGFDHWWDDIDSDTKNEIRRTLVKVVENQ